LLIANPKRDFPWFAEHKIDLASKLFSSREFARLLEIAMRFAVEGREGKSIGSIFVLGDPEELRAYLRPLILNPCEGHPRKVRQIHDIEFFETLRELASLDGAFIVDRRGVVESAGVYLDAPVTKKISVGKGLGARHTAAAAMSAKCAAIAIVVSESSGTVSVYNDGAATLQIQRGS
jgi:DNA integrity scanning protein DisA with diadenylate cyclase activity